VKISLLISDLSHNCLLRTYVFARILEKHYQVEIIGPDFGGGIWPPCDTGEFAYKIVAGKHPLFSPSSWRKMLSLISGDVIYAFSPRILSYGIGLLKKRSTGLPIVLDIHERQTAFVEALHPRLIPRIIIALLTLGCHDNYFYALAMERLIKYADQITVGSSFLAQAYGGVRVPHGRDVNLFNPANYDRKNLRKEWGYDSEKLIVFFGSPAPYKGFEDLVEAVRLLGRPDLKVMLVGADRSLPYVRDLIESLTSTAGDFLRIEGMQPFSDVPKFLSMADLVVLPQRPSPVTMAQIPAKILDAMAMAKPIISTAMSDIPEILEGCGIVVEPGNVEQIAERIEYILEYEEEAAEMGKRAREKCAREYSREAVEKVLIEVFDRYR
jgi:glycosyltransferase involved in cell wall biosynthesis